MFVGLGFLIASFLVVLITPAYRARTVRLTSERVRALLPATEAELRADKDRIRADSAIRIHRLESQLEQLKFDAARQMVEVGRRDGQISTLSGTLEELHGELEAAKNARGVLEQTIADRLPKVEQRLIEAKKLLFQRDREIAALNQDAERTQRALVEAVQINTQQKAEVERLVMVLETRAAQNRDGLADPTFDTELALRSEIEALRTRSRDQASLIERLQTGEAVATANSDAGEDVPEVVRLQRDLMRAESALKAMRDVASAGQVEQSRYDADVRTRDQKIEDQAQEIARLAAALAAFEQPAVGGEQAGSLRDSKIAMKAKLSSLQVQADQQGETIRKLRAEVAAANEKLARQAQHFMEEMRRLGAGTLPASTRERRPAAAKVVRRSLTERISEAKPELAAGLGAAVRPVLVKSDAPAAVAAVVAAPQVVEEPSKINGVNGREHHMPEADQPSVAAAASPQPPEADAASTRPLAAPVRSKLMDRIAEYGKG